MTNGIHVIGAACGWGAKNVGTELGPQSLIQDDLLEIIHKGGYNVTSQMVVPAQTGKNLKTPTERLPDEIVLPLIADFSKKLAEITHATFLRKEFPLIIGGDHMIAAASWSGIISALNAEESFGLIWIDAHLDAHTFKTSPSKSYHGMPISFLMGHGDPQISHLIKPKTKLNPRHLVYIGIRSFEQEELDFLKAHNVKIFFIEDVKKLGFAEVFRQALEIVTDETKGFGISFDIDVFDASLVQATGTPEPNGISLEDVLPSLENILSNKDLKAFEIVEYNPLLENKTKETRNLILTLIKGLFKCHS